MKTKITGLTGIEIPVGNIFKFVGKVGIIPKFSVPQTLVGHKVFYREAIFADVFSHEMKAYSVDREAWEAAESLEAVGMVIFLKDRNQTVVATKSAIQKSPVVDLGERPQYRIPAGEVNVHYNTAPVKMGFTTVVHRCGSTPKKPLEEKPSRQGQLFGILLALIMLAGCAGARMEPRYLPPWIDSISDGCSHVSDITPAVHACCVRHDEAYYYGGSKADRKRADKALRDCIIATGQPKAVAQWFFAGVQLFGDPGFRDPGVSWAFGGSFFRYSKEPARPEGNE